MLLSMFNSLQFALLALRATRSMPQASIALVKVCKDDIPLKVGLFPALPIDVLPCSIHLVGDLMSFLISYSMKIFGFIEHLSKWSLFTSGSNSI